MQIGTRPPPSVLRPVQRRAVRAYTVFASGSSSGLSQVVAAQQLCLNQSPDADRNEATTERPSTGAKTSCSGLHCVRIGELLWPEPSRCCTTTLPQSEP